MKAQFPSFTDSEIQAIGDTFAQLRPRAHSFALDFYRRLFELDPSVRSLFHGDMSSQGQKLMDMLDFIASNLRESEVLVPTVRALGMRHAEYNVQPEHYALVGRALLETMSTTLGPAMPGEAPGAWQRAYNYLAALMISASEPAPQELA